MQYLQYLDSIKQDIRYALRTLKKSPTFTLGVLLTLGITIGATTAMFSVVYAVLLKPLPYYDSGRLVGLSLEDTHDRKRDGAFTLIRLEMTRTSAHSFTGMGAYLKLPESVSLSSLKRDRPEALEAARVSANFLDILNVKPILGRGFLLEEDKTDGPLVAMISSNLWKRSFLGDPEIIGKIAQFNAKPYTIVGVLPEGFAFPFPEVDVWFTRPTEWSLVAQGDSLTILDGFARLKQGISLSQAQAEMDVVNRQYVLDNSERLDAAAGMSLRVVSLKDYFVANARPILWLLFGAVSFVLAVACANIAGLLLARGSSRSREIAIRAAVGAVRLQLLRQLLLESLVLALSGGVIGTILAASMLQGIRHVTAIDLPRTQEIHVNAVILLFTAGVSTITGILFGLFPALQATRRDPANELRESAGNTKSESLDRKGIAGIGMRSTLVVCQIAVSVTLLIGATLLIKSFIRLRSVDPGFRTDNLLTMKIALPTARYNTEQSKTAFFQGLVRRTETIAGVRGAAVAMSLPTTRGWLGTNILIEDQPVGDDEDEPTARFQSVTSNYFPLLRIALRRGRYFTQRDESPGAPPVVIINESFARTFWPAYPSGRDPVGLHLREGIDKNGWAEIVGIVADVHEGDLAADSVPEFYVPTVVHAPQRAYLVLSTKGKPESFAEAVRNELGQIDPDQPAWDIRSMDDIMNSTLGQRRLTMILVGSLASVALLLALVGIYGVIAYSVVQRTKEIGIRRALGAAPSQILGLVINQGLSLAFLGTGLGVVGALALTRVMSSLLFHVNATDPLTFAWIVLLMMVVTFLASYIPARRAAQLDPLAALRMV